MPFREAVSAPECGDFLVDILLPIHAPHPFTYRLAVGSTLPPRGARVLVSVGSREMVGVFWGPARMPFVDADRIKEVGLLLDEEPLFPDSLLVLLERASAYYLHPLGMVLAEALPPGLLSPKGSRIEKIRKARRKRPASIDLPAWPSVRPERFTDEQEAALLRILPAVDEGGFRTFLIFGVTGSGKTEIYLEAARRSLERGKDVLFLVPEISMTTQAAGHFRARFGEDVIVLHSSLTESQRIEEWQRVRTRTGRVVVGTRSAVFAPVSDLGLVVVDEEHDPSYKQESGFRYNGRDLAILRAQIASAPVILGSATPALSSYQSALSGRYELIRLTKRVEERPLPEVSVVDLRRKVGVQRRPRQGEGLPRWMTLPLFHAMEETLGRKEQVLLFLNRRGFATFVFCPDCGHVFRCPHCEVTLTWHRGKDFGDRQEEGGGTLRCHYCGQVRPALPVCPACGGHAVRATGYGTERVAEDVRALFPDVRVERLDRDTVQGRRKRMEGIVHAFHEGAVHVLVGTQMVTKGHDFPGLTLVGILSADLSLNIPEYTAGERTFQLLSQVAGRAGRAGLPGRVIIQTWNPGHYAVECATRHDYAAFFEQEAALRKNHLYPPFASMVNIRLTGAKKDMVEKAAVAIAQEGRRFASMPSLSEPVEILGPSPAPHARLKGIHRHQILFRSRSRAALRAVILPLTSSWSRSFPGVRVEVDVDPVQLL